LRREIACTIKGAAGMGGVSFVNAVVR